MKETCSDCGAEAHLSLSMGNEVTRLCPICLDRRLPKLRLGSLLSSMHPDKKRLDACPYCGCTLAVAEASGLFGCPLCYDVFEESLGKAFGVGS
jgi:protein-arginine kinase activator protein McsA